MSRRFIAFTQLSIASCLIGSTVVVGKLITHALPVGISGLLRFGIAALILACLVFVFEKKFQRLRLTDVFLLAVQSFFGIFLFNVALLLGLRMTGAIESGIICGTLPAITALFSAFFLRERLSYRQVLSIVSVVIGVGLLSFGQSANGSTASASMRGVLLIVLSVACEAAFIVIGKKVSFKLPPLQSAALVSFFGVLFFILFSIRDLAAFDMQTVSVPALLGVIYYALDPTVLGYILFYKGISELDANVVGVITALVPVSAVALASLILGEQISLTHVGGGALVLMGIGVTVLRRKKKHVSAGNCRSERRPLRAIIRWDG